MSSKMCLTGCRQVASKGSPHPQSNSPVHALIRSRKLTGPRSWAPYKGVNDMFAIGHVSLQSYMKFQGVVVQSSNELIFEMHSKREKWRFEGSTLRRCRLWYHSCWSETKIKWYSVRLVHVRRGVNTAGPQHRCEGVRFFEQSRDWSPRCLIDQYHTTHIAYSKRLESMDLQIRSHSIILFKLDR